MRRVAVLVDKKIRIGTVEQLLHQTVCSRLPIYKVRPGARQRRLAVNSDYS